MNHPVFITGVGKRIGYELARHFLYQGHAVIGTYRTHHMEVDDLKSLGAELYQCDFSRASDVKELLGAVRSKHSSLRALIHNASDWCPDPAAKSTPDDQEGVMHRMMHIHAVIPYQLNLALEDKLKACEEGADIIHITDYVASCGSKKHIAYAASKAALENMNLSFAQLFSPQIKVNAIAPALIKFNPGDTEAYQDKALKKALLPREGGYEEVSRAVDFILASEYMTGRSLHLDGGRHLKS